MVGLVDTRIDRASFGAELRWTRLLGEFHQERVVSGCRVRAHRIVEQRCWNWALLVVIGSFIGFWLGLASSF
jgi:hypothetical protein